MSSAPRSAKRQQKASKPLYSADEFRLGLEKTTELRSLNLSPTPSLAATLIFAQYECGTAICVSPHGDILTCAHCLDEDAPAVGIFKLLLFSSGLLVLASSVKVDVVADVALLRILGVLDEHGTLDSSPRYDYPHVSLASQSPILGAALTCYGQPGRDDLESEKSRKTSYDCLCLSTGFYRGCAKGDVMDNSEIGSCSIRVGLTGGTAARRF